MPESSNSSDSSSKTKAQQVVEEAMKYVNRHNPYAYCGSGEALTDANVNKLAKAHKNDSDAHYDHLKPGGKDYDKVNQSGMECIDCSGLTRKVYKKFGKNLEHSSKSQYNAGKDMGWKNAQPGDLIVRPGHAAIMGDNGKMIEAKGWKWGCTNDRKPDSQYKAIRLVSGGSYASSGTTSSSTSTTTSSSSFNVDAAVKYNKARNYSKSDWKKIQAAVGTTADGIPGKNTAKAIYSWQKAHGLTADGKCGPATYSAICSATSSQSSTSQSTTQTTSTSQSTTSQTTTQTTTAQTTTTTTSSTSSSSSSSSSSVQINVSAAVSYNNARGYSKALWKQIQAIVGTTADGIPGKNTAQAIAVWQKANGLTADGKCGPATLAKMKLK